MRDKSNLVKADTREPPIPALDASAAPRIIVLAAGEVTSRVVVFFGMMVVARRVGPLGFGVLGLASAICGYLVLFVRGGLDELGAREVARSPSQVAQLYTAIASVRVAIACVALLFLALLLPFFPLSVEARWVVWLSGLALLPLALDATWVFRGLQRPGIAALATVVGQSIYVIGLIALVHGADDLLRVPVAQVIGEAIAAAALALLALSWRIPRPRLAEGWRLLVAARYLTGARVSRSVILSFDVIFLGLTGPAAVLGLYTAPYRVCFLLMALVGSVVAAYLPRCALGALEGEKAMAIQLTGATRSSVSIAAPLVAGGIVTATPAMELLFGPAYEAGSHAFVLLMVSMAAYSVHAPLSLSFLVRQRTGQQAIIYAGAALLNVVANVMLIPRFGIVGAAVAAICAEASIAVACLWALRSSSPWRPMLRGLVEPVGCAAVMALALVTVAGRMHVLIQILLGGSLYVTLLWLTTMRRRRAQG